jgi:hypothetical protein
VLANIGFRAFLEGGGSDLNLYGFSFFTCGSLLLHDVDARCAAITFDSETRIVAS